MNSPFTLWWDKKTRSICYIDQTLLPNEERIVECRSVRRLAKAIQRLEIRGAPALGVAGAFGVALAASLLHGKRQWHRFLQPLHAMQRCSGQPARLRSTSGGGLTGCWKPSGMHRTVAAARERALAEAEKMFHEDTACCHAIGEHGATLLPDTCTVLTHCNAGALACSSWGTALGVIRSAVKAGKQVNVIACETRPLLQGARLTAWELSRDGIPVTVITDSMAAHFMRTEKIDAVIVGADRITADAVFNKIGTYMHAVCARHHKIPFYVAAPLSTFDLTRKARDVVIEERGRDEIATDREPDLCPACRTGEEPGIRCNADGTGDCHHHGKRDHPPALCHERPCAGKD